MNLPDAENRCRAHIIHGTDTEWQDVEAILQEVDRMRLRLVETARRITDLESSLQGRELLSMKAWAEGTARIQNLEAALQKACTPKTEDWLDGPVQDEVPPRTLEAAVVALLKREFENLLGLGEWQETRQDVLNLIATIEALRNR
jgi:hypothetical protein